MNAHLRPAFHAFAMLAALAIAGATCAQGTGDPTPGALGRSADTIVVNAADGIDAEEAKRIALAYFDRHVGCGSFMAIADGGDHWIIQGLHGLGAAEIKGFTIDKRSGAITSPIGPSYSDPQMRIERTAPPALARRRQRPPQSDGGR